MTAKQSTFHMTRFLAEPEFFKLQLPLVKALIKKTRYHADKLGKKFKYHFGPHKNLGEYRLNVLDPAKPIFSKLTATEKTTREATIRPRNTSD
jgi:hypothetical protein